MEMPNAGAVVFGKADKVEPLPVPEWARANFSTAPNVLLNPLDVYASAGQMGEGYRKVAGKRVWPWQRKKVREGAYQMAMGRSTLYQPLGSGRSYS
jgi:hypothetical protein